MMSLDNAQEYLSHEQFYGLCELLLEQERVMRWGHKDLDQSDLRDLRESVLSHVGGMHIIKMVIREMYLPELKHINWDVVDNLISIHDLPEIKCGDKVRKTKFDRAREEKAELGILSELEHFGLVGQSIITQLDQYAEKNGATGSKNSAESRLTKTIDEIHGLMKMIIAGRPDFNYADHERGRSEGVFKKNAQDKFPWLFDYGLYLVELRTARYHLDVESTENK